MFHRIFLAFVKLADSFSKESVPLSLTGSISLESETLSIPSKREGQCHTLAFHRKRDSEVRFTVSTQHFKEPRYLIPPTRFLAITQKGTSLLRNHSCNVGEEVEF